eukprot:g64872.t1
MTNATKLSDININIPWDKLEAKMPKEREREGLTVVRLQRYCKNKAISSHQDQSHVQHEHRSSPLQPKCTVTYQHEKLCKHSDVLSEL